MFFKVNYIKVICSSVDKILKLICISMAGELKALKSIYGSLVNFIKQLPI